MRVKPPDTRIDTAALRARLDALELNVTDLASRVGVDQSTAANWLAGRKQPRLARAILMAEALGMPVGALIPALAPPKSDPE